MVAVGGFDNVLVTFRVQEAKDRERPVSTDSDTRRTAAGFPAGRGTPVAIGLGSNLGDRAARLTFGARRLATLLESPRCSSVYETEPRELEEQPRFLNACCVGRSTLGPAELLHELKAIERAAGRIEAGPRFGPRELDLDILLYGGKIVETPELTIPHPRLAERAFVLVPLREIVPGWRHPVLGRSIAELAERVDPAGVERAPTRLGVAEARRGGAGGGGAARSGGDERRSGEEGGGSR